MSFNEWWRLNMDNFRAHILRNCQSLDQANRYILECIKLLRQHNIDPEQLDLGAIIMSQYVTTLNIEKANLVTAGNIDSNTLTTPGEIRKEPDMIYIKVHRVEEERIVNMFRNKNAPLKDSEFPGRGKIKWDFVK